MLYRHLVGRLRPLLTGLPVVLALAAPGPAFAAGKPSAKWMAHCTANLKSEGLKPTAVRKYCACMDGLGGDDEMLKLTQTELERSYPPAHLDCHRKARR